MTAKQRRRLTAGPFTVELTTEEILEDLSWPGRPPGRWLEPEEPRELPARPRRDDAARAA